MKYIVSILIILSSLYGTIAMADEVSLRDKIGQMLIMGFEGKEVNHHSPIVQSMLNENIGGVILFDYNYQTKRFDKNIESPQQVQQLNAQLQQFAQLANQSHNRPLLPLLISVDYEGGSVDRLKVKYGFPATLSAADVGKMSESDASEAANRMARTLKESGFNLNFAPVLDVNVNVDNPIIGKLDRSFSDDASTVSRYANVYANSFLSHGIQCAYKHFPGHGSSTADSHLGFVDVTDTWKPYELEPYSSLLGYEQACGMIMTAHVINRQLDETGLPATLSYEMLTKVLREKLQFDGVIITDDMQMKAISDHYGLEQSIKLAINAGADMLIFGNQLSDKPQDSKAIVDMIEIAVNAGYISQDRIDDAYQHILVLKQSLHS
jgi:beta-N-acetylhexosaminidase